ncbi:MAG: hypothetical protein KF745_14665 [Phycisphaeraceae bacterium]|nr:hypothetical protein [Phycisphaeraceae bacterium]
MTESQFWVHLEFRLCREFQGLPERRYQYFWCDGIDPEQYTLDAPSPRISGRATICNGPMQSWTWTFVLLLPRPVSSRDAIEWASLLPPENMTCWMSFDEDKQSLEIDPSVAKPDL